MMKRKSIILLFALLAGCGSKERSLPVNLVTAEQNTSEEVVTEVIPIKQVIRTADVLDVIFHVAGMTEDAYLIQPGDQVEITFLTADELSGSRLILPDGTVQLPYVGSVKFSGKTALQVQQELVEAYRKTLRTPELVVSVSSAMAQMNLLRETLRHPSSGLSREILVGTDGRASFPLIGSVDLQNRTMDEIQTEINQRYRQYNPLINAEVLLKSTDSNKVFVLGEVRQPGSYPVNRAVSVFEALTLANGTTPNARLDSVVVMRREGDQAVAHVFDMKKSTKGKGLNMAYLQPDDLLYIPQTRLSKAAQISRQVADTILFQGVGVGFSYRLDNKDDRRY